MGTVSKLGICADHPTFAGHFPGAPILPGAVLLDATLWELEQLRKQPRSRWQIVVAKFQNAVRPGETVTLEHEELANGSIRFAIRAAGRVVANGILAPGAVPPKPDDGA